MKRINIQREKCIGCLTCVTTCMIRHQSEESNNRVVLSSEKKPSPLFCRHCSRPECVYTCMSGAMNKDELTGYVHYNQEQCAHCHMCIMACPYGILKEDTRTQTRVQKCDMCKPASADEPDCVRHCPMKALSLEEY